MMTLFFDTETTGKADFRAPANAPHQPRIVQLAAILMDAQEREVMSMNVIIRPDGWTIPAEASDIHGITTEYAQQVGIPIAAALQTFGFMSRATVRYVAHNVEFDRLMVAADSFRALGQSMPVPPWECFCTMQAMTNICRLPGQFPGKFKWPKLTEAYQHCFGTTFEDAHDALADVRACAKVYFWLQNQKAQVAA